MPATSAGMTVHARSSRASHNRAPSSAGARAMRCSRARPRCSRRCCRGSRSISRAPPPADLRTLFDGVDDVRLEIGFGGGEHLIAEAERHPRTGFIGSEPFVNGMAKALALIERAQARAISACITATPPSCSPGCRARALARIDLLYPDPWPKRRHWKRRFVQDESVAAIARMLRPGGEFRFATDIAGLRRLDAGAAVALAGFRLDRGARRRLAQALAGLFRHALRGQGQARRPRALLSDVPTEVDRAGSGRVARRAAAPARTAPRAARSTATASRNWQRPRRAPGSTCPCRSGAP